MKCILDRFEGDFAILEIDDDTIVEIPKILVNNASEGDVINISVLKNETKKRKKKIDELMNELFEK